MTEDTLLQTANSRQNMYSFLAGIFLQEPAADRWVTQRQALRELLTELKEVVEEEDITVPEDNSTVIERIRQEYFDCFFVPMSGKYVPPYESALIGYKPGEKKPYGFLNSPESVHVANCYSAVGYKPNELDVFPPLKEVQFPDHVGFELGFMATLCVAEMEALKNNDFEEASKWQKLQGQFLKDHLNKWLGNFAYALQSLAPGYYAQAAKVAEKWVSYDMEELAKSINEGGKSVEH